MAGTSSEAGVCLNGSGCSWGFNLPGTGIAAGWNGTDYSCCPGCLVPVTGGAERDLVYPNNGCVGDWDVENTTLGYDNNDVAGDGNTSDLPAEYYGSDSTPGNSLKITDKNKAKQSEWFKDRRDIDGDNFEYEGESGYVWILSTSDGDEYSPQITPHDLPSKKFYYKYALVYDGNHIVPLSTEPI